MDESATEPRRVLGSTSETERGKGSGEDPRENEFTRSMALASGDMANNGVGGTDEGFHSAVGPAGLAVMALARFFGCSGVGGGPMMLVDAERRS